MANKTYITSLIFFLLSFLYGQFQEDFLGHWTGIEELESPSITYENRNISIVVEIGGDRDGFYTFTSSCDFLFNDDVEWAFHYIAFDKESDQLIFLRRFITPLGVLGYEELIYDLTEWSTQNFVAEHNSESGDTFHQIRMDIEVLNTIGTIPSGISLSENYPNPFNPSTKIDVSIDIEAQGRLAIYDLSGRQVKVLKEGRFHSGISRFLWNGSDYSGKSVSSGVYVCRLFVGGEYIQSQKMTLLK